jgi:hypothetical protein
MSNGSDRILRKFDEFEAGLRQTEKQLSDGVRVLNEVRPDHMLRVNHADWHVRGLLYHCRNLLASYQDVAQETGDRVVGTNANVVVLYAPTVQRMWFEFYALVNLARITLDSLRNLLAPVFVTDFGQLPKSISGFIEGHTDCPVYAALATDPAVTYLSDIRNCLVHFRSFATSDNAVITDEARPDMESQLNDLPGSDWLRSMAKGEFRRVGETGVSTNFYLPDVIFERCGTDKRLARFTYRQKYNVLSQSIGFVRLVAEAVDHSLLLLLDPGQPTYQYSKAKR